MQNNVSCEIITERLAYRNILVDIIYEIYKRAKHTMIEYNQKNSRYRIKWPVA